jgi:hypothetical protein
VKELIRVDIDPIHMEFHCCPAGKGNDNEMDISVNDNTDFILFCRQFYSHCLFCG